MTMDYLDDLDRCAGCGAVEPPQRVTLDDDLCDTFGVAGPGVACLRCAKIARDRAGRDALEALCLRHGCEWSLDLTAARPVVTLHRGGGVIGRAAGDTLADAVRAHVDVMDAPAPTTPDRGPLRADAVYRVAAHPVAHASDVVWITRRAGVSAETVRDYAEAAALDPSRVAVRFWLTTDPRECPADCMEG
jgi:hypothetical protein